jgi:hypothetical protein
MRNALRLAARFLLIVIAFGTCASVPPRQGTKLTLGGGYGHRRYDPTGCGGTIRGNETSAYTAITHRAASGFTISAETSVGVTAHPSGRPPLVAVFADARVGYHADYGGFELGPALYLRHGQDDLDTFPAGSVKWWAGVPDVIYFWNTGFAGPFSLASLPLGAGLGHRGETISLEAGAMISQAGDDPPVRPNVHVESLLHLSESVDLGVTANWTPKAYRGAILLGLRFPD